MASCEPDRLDFCSEANRIEKIVLGQLEDARRTKLLYVFWVTHASSILGINYDKQRALSKSKNFQDLLKLVANCFYDDYDHLLCDATDDEACRLVCCFQLVAQLVEDTSDDEKLKEMFVSVTDDEEADRCPIDGEETAVLASVEEADRKISNFSSQALAPSLDTSDLQKAAGGIIDDHEPVVTSSATSLRWSPAASLKSSCQTSETLPDLELWCKSATREDLMERVLYLSLK